jgi:hypothetical protein
LRLYHFAKVVAVPSIKTHGLLPHDDTQNMVGCEQIVWLTELQDTHLTVAESARIFERTGVWTDRWLEFTSRAPLTRFALARMIAS